ncbi:hypothetical protein PDIDSM_3090 [Penicillium digitatum]|nr:hypothetical protein PDIDSM_3090 [Penicillium digitatum]
MAIVQCIGARKLSVPMLALANATKAPIPLGAKAMRQAPAGKSNHPSKLRSSKVLGTHPPQESGRVFSSSGFISTYTASTQSATVLYALPTHLRYCLTGRPRFKTPAHAAQQATGFFPT